MSQCPLFEMQSASFEFWGNVQDEYVLSLKRQQLCND
ncbi:hypothetical protein BAQU_1012 [Bifidobacterium aquikefiri]|uniref:Uncharacterized protein n=1 Tax=Bifidobacterium aquikefiri TaxID=1653207 RepID=A0A261G696_9BIFI|nr:hypothetical protein BAQU_1012 [Bifidobacterium aquikefiri]